MEYNKEFFAEIVNDLENNLNDDFEIEESYQESNFKIVINRKKIINSEIFGLEINISNSFLLDVVVIDPNGDIVDFVNQKHSNQKELVSEIFKILNKHLKF
ncbi:hypothetical protein [Epilithonimonas caeni]|uniref:hypothetical protein n=1 Tax=Epilithonimonas caeni TaxID=365343 RepID=UPI0004121E37|nr:hypothetical protein [Epilithonimonas caeni]